MSVIMTKRAKTKTRNLSTPWITEDGFLDPLKIPIDSILTQTVLQDLDAFRSGCSMLQTMYGHGRLEAGIYLLGLLQYYQDDLERLEVIVKKLSGFKTNECADSLVSELKRVKSSNTTRRYLGTVLQILSAFPSEIAKEKLEELADDASFSYKMRKKFENALDEMFNQSIGY